MPLTIIVKGKNFKPYRSPITGEVIDSHRKHEKHMKDNDVVPLGEFGENEGKEWFARKKKERENTPFNKENVNDRKQKLIAAIERHGNFK
jgi:hypothetical protein